MLATTFEPILKQIFSNLYINYSFDFVEDVTHMQTMHLQDVEFQTVGKYTVRFSKQTKQKPVPDILVSMQLHITRQVAEQSHLCILQFLFEGQQMQRQMHVSVDANTGKLLTDKQALNKQFCESWINMIYEQHVLVKALVSDAILK